LDGGNCCLKDGQVFGRTHAQPASHESFSAVKELAANLGPQLEGVQLFGENMQVRDSSTWFAMLPDIVEVGGPCIVTPRCIAQRTSAH